MTQAPRRWAEAIGACYNLGGMADALNATAGQVFSASKQGSLFYFDTAENIRMFPAGQVRFGMVSATVGVVTRALCQRFDRQYVAVWMNEKRFALDGRSVWEALDCDEATDVFIATAVRDTCLAADRAATEELPALAAGNDDH